MTRHRARDPFVVDAARPVAACAFIAVVVLAALVGLFGHIVPVAADEVAVLPASCSSGGGW